MVLPRNGSKRSIAEQQPCMSSRRAYRLTRFRRRFGHGLAQARRCVATPSGTLFIGFSCLYILTYQGSTNTFDGQSMFATTRALVDRATLSISDPLLGTIGRSGLFYSKYGIGQSLAEAPLYLAGKVAAQLLRSPFAPQLAEAVAMLTNPLISALICTVFYRIVRLMAYTRATAIRASVVLGLATSLWPYAKSDYSEPLLTLTLVAAVLCSLQATHLIKAAGAEVGVDRRLRHELLRLDALAGTALGAGLLAKYAALIYVPVFVVYATITGQHIAARVRHCGGAPRWLWCQRMLALLLPVLVAGMLVLAVDALRFGSPWTTGYGPTDGPFSGPLLTGLDGLLAGPYSGLLFYDPLLFVGLLAVPVMLWRRQLEVLFPLGLFVGSALFYGAYHAWSGGPAWGPRYLVPALPYLLLPLVVLGWFGPAETPRTTATRTAEPPRLPGSWLHRLTQGVFAAAVVVSVVVQLLGVCVNDLLFAAYWDPPFYPHLQDSGSLVGSPLAFSLWTLRLSLQYTFTKSFAPGYRPHAYPFGPPFPVELPLWFVVPPYQPPGALPLQYFWFTLLPDPVVACAVGVLVLGWGMAVTAHRLVQFSRRS